MSESDSVVVRALVSHPVDQGSNLASATLFFLSFLDFSPNFEGKFLVSAKFSNRGTVLMLN